MFSLIGRKQEGEWWEDEGAGEINLSQLNFYSHAKHVKKFGGGCASVPEGFETSRKSGKAVRANQVSLIGPEGWFVSGFYAASTRRS